MPKTIELKYARAIIPDPVDYKAANRVLRNLVRRISRRAGTQFRRTVKNWSPENRPVFREHTSVTKNRISASVETSSVIYATINNGIDQDIKARQDHPKINPKTGERYEYNTMTWKGPYKAHTRPGSLDSGQSSRGEDSYMDVQAHWHIEPRHFDRLVKKELESWLNKTMMDAQMELSEATGHWYKWPTTRWSG